jgi:hypothetical protein
MATAAPTTSPSATTRRTSATGRIPLALHLVGVRTLLRRTPLLLVVLLLLQLHADHQFATLVRQMGRRDCL